MIRIKRPRCPAVLKNAGTDSDRYRHPKVVATLWEMQNGKCCYCEQIIPEKGHAKAVEHFAPKSVFRAKRNHWTNLLLACAQCNGKKADQFPEMLTDKPHDIKLLYVQRTTRRVPALIDPSEKTNPEEHLSYHVDLSDGPLAGQIFPRDGSPRGRTTISVIGLDGTFFHAQRREHFITLLRLSSALLGAIENEDRLRAVRLEWQNAISRSSVFAGLAREFARKTGLGVNYGIHITDSP